MSTLTKLSIFSFVVIIGLLPAVPVSAAKVCGSCRSAAEGADRTKASAASKWTGTIIGINDGANEFVITEGTKLDHIKAFAQRSIRVTANTGIEHNGEPKAFGDLTIGSRITVFGSYNAAQRIVSATRIETGSVAAAPTPKPAPAPSPKPAPAPTTKSKTPAKKIIPRTKAEITRIQKLLVQKGYLKMPRGAAYGTLGKLTKDALARYNRYLARNNQAQLSL